MEGMKAKIVDIPFAKWDPPAENPTGCRVENSAGVRCGRTVWKEEMCAVHGQWHDTISASMGLPFPEDQLSLHRFLLRALDMVISGRISDRRLKTLEGLCKMIYKNVKTGKWEV